MSTIEWSKFFLSHYHHQPPSLLHLWLSEKLDSITRKRGSHLAIQAPRGEAKSTYCSLFYPLRCALEHTEDYIIICSDSSDQTKKLIAHIREEVEENHLLAQMYPEAMSRVRANAHRIVFGNGVVIEGLSTGQKIRGARKRAKRPTLIIIDDPEAEDNKISPTLSAQTKDWFDNAVLKAGEPGTNFIVLATALYRDSLSMSLQGKAGWISKTFTAIVRWPEQMALWNEWEKLYTMPAFTERERELIDKKSDAFLKANWKELHRGAIVSWPERNSLVDLMKERATQGHAAFEAERQNNPINPDDREWPPEYFDLHIWCDELPNVTAYDVRLAYLDPSKGKESRFGDFGASVFIGSIGRMLYIDAELVKKPANLLVEGFVDFCDRHHVDVAALESNGFQELLAPMFYDVQGRGFTTPLHLIHNARNKEVRIREITSYLAQKRMKFVKNKMTMLLVQQLQDFPLADHDDGPDALAGCLRLGYELQAGHVSIGKKNEPDAIDELMGLRG